MDTLLILGFVFLLCASAFLLFGLLHARKDARDLAAQLTLAREQQHRNQLQISERSHIDTLKDEFISTVSHELRTPLTSIRGALGLLSSGVIGEVDSKALNLLRIATVNTDRLIRLISDILDIERMESGRAALQIRRCSLRDLCQQAIDTMTPMADANGIKLELEVLPTAESLFFDADPDRILQVITNLLSNAITFSAAGTTVRIETEPMPDSLVLRVCDEGRGIPADKLEA